MWGRSWAGANRTLDVHVATLRTKLGRPALVETVRGVGYRLTADGQAARDRLRCARRLLGIFCHRGRDRWCWAWAFRWR